MCPLTASVSAHKISRLNQGYYFIHAFDPDKAGKRASKAVRQGQPHAIHKMINLPDGKDPGDMTVEDFATELEKFVPLDSSLLD